MRAAILRDSNPESSLKWELACRKADLAFRSIDLLAGEWLKELKDHDPAFCVGRPPGNCMRSKRTFDEKIFMVEKELGIPVFPDYLSTLIYENKRALAWFLEASGIPHPSTFCSSNYRESIDFASRAQYPLVAKTLIGASGKGVEILHSREGGLRYVEKAFKQGIRRRYGPNRQTGRPRHWIKKAFGNPSHLVKKLKQYGQEYGDVQKGVVLFQEYIQHDFEWRCVKIGKSYFAYKKMKGDGKASGAQIFEYGPPPESLLDLTRSICDNAGFFTMSLDVFVHRSSYLVNEMQAIFGHSKPYICMVNGAPGRYLRVNGAWSFQPGDFNGNESYDLRIAEILEHLREK